MEITTRTLEAAALQTASFVGIPHTYPQNSTLNQLLDIENGMYPPADAWPQCRYSIIGYGGHRPQQTTDGRHITLPIQHRTTDLGLFSPLPYILRQVTSDLSAVERARYCLRRLETHGGLTFAAYYGKRIDFTGAFVERQLNTVTDEQTNSISEVVYSAANLSPEPTQLQPAQLNLTTGQYVSPICKIWVGLDNEWEANELINVSRVKFGDDYGALISEIGLVTGVDKLVGVDSASGSFMFNEVIGAQLAAHIACNYSVALGTNLRAGTYVNIGIAEPMFIIS
jgi:hypothetical protein